MSGKVVRAEELENAMRKRNAERRPTSTPADLILGFELGGPKETEILVNKIVPGRYQPRTKIDTQSVELLAENIKEVGLNQPIVVRELEDGMFELIAGETRWHAFKLLGMDTIPAVVRILDDAAAAKATVADNVMRNDITDFEIGIGLKKLKDEGVETTTSGLARIIGKDRADVIRYLSFFDLPNESIEALKNKPSVLGGTYAKQIAEFSKNGHGQIVAEAIQMLIDGKLTQSRAVSWLETRLNLRKRSDPTPVNNLAGARLGVLHQTGKKLQFKAEPGIDIDMCARLIIEALAKTGGAEGGGNG